MEQNPSKPALKVFVTALTSSPKDAEEPMLLPRQNLGRSTNTSGSRRRRKRGEEDGDQGSLICRRITFSIHCLPGQQRRRHPLEAGWTHARLRPGLACGLWNDAIFLPSSFARADEFPRGKKGKEPFKER